MVTTIKLKDNTKMKLENLKKNNQSYDDVVENLIDSAKKEKIKEELKECYKKSGDLKILKEWESSSNEV